MILREEKEIIEINPNIEFANRLISEEIKRGGSYARIHPNISDKLGSFVLGKIELTSDHLPLDFTGGNDRYYAFDGELKDLYADIVEVVKKHSQYITSIDNETIDNLLFATLFSWGESSERHDNDNSLSYLDELIKLYLRLKKGKVVIGNRAASSLSIENRARGFDKLSNDIQEILIDDELVKAEARNVGGIGVNKLIYIPSDMNIVIEGRNNKENIVLPSRISSKVYKLILNEIISEHESNDTNFYKKLYSEDFDAINLERTITFRRSKKNIKLLNYLILLMDSYIVESNQFRIIKKHRYVLIYDILKALSFFKHYHANREDKYTYIRTIIRDNKPENLRKTYGEKQLFR